MGLEIGIRFTEAILISRDKSHKSVAGRSRQSGISEEDQEITVVVSLNRISKREIGSESSKQEAGSGASRIPK